MPFDVTGARAAGYSDSDIASHLGQQSGFDSAGAIKSGYSPLDVINHLTLTNTAGGGRGSINNYAGGASSTPSATASSSPLGNAFSDTAKLLSGDGDADDGKTQVGAAESALRGWVGSGGNSAKYTALAVSSVPVVAEAVINLAKTAFGGKADTSWQDAALKNLVDPAQNAVDWAAIQPNEKQNLLGKVSSGVGGMLQN